MLVLKVAVKDARMDLSEATVEIEPVVWSFLSSVKVVYHDGRVWHTAVRSENGGGNAYRNTCAKKKKKKKENKDRKAVRVNCSYFVCKLTRATDRIGSSIHGLKV